MDARRTHALGTLALAAGSALFVLALSVVVVGVVSVVDGSATVRDVVRTVVTTLSRDSTQVPAPGRALYVGVVGLGVSLWLLGIGLLLQGRSERR